jgi:hypothetical protein
MVASHTGKSVKSLEEKVTRAKAVLADVTKEMDILLARVKANPLGAPLADRVADSLLRNVEGALAIVKAAPEMEANAVAQVQAAVGNAMRAGGGFEQQGGVIPRSALFTASKKRKKEAEGMDAAGYRALLEKHPATSSTTDTDIGKQAHFRLFLQSSNLERLSLLEQKLGLPPSSSSSSTHVAIMNRIIQRVLDLAPDFFDLDARVGDVALLGDNALVLLKSTDVTNSHGPCTASAGSYEGWAFEGKRAQARRFEAAALRRFFLTTSYIASEI